MGLPLGALLVVLPAAAASVVSVSSADELRAAFADASATEVRLAADIFLGSDESFTSSYARTLDGDGFGIYQGEGAAPILEVEAPLALVDATLAKTFAPTAEPTYGPTAARYAPTAAPTLFVCLMIRAEIALHRPGLTVLSNLLLFAAALLPLFAFATVVAGALGEKPPEEEDKEEAEKPDSPPGSPWGDDKAPAGGLSPSELAARASGATAAVARAEQEAEVYDRVYEDDAPASPVTCGAACLPDFGPRGGVTFSEPASLPRDFRETESL